MKVNALLTFSLLFMFSINGGEFGRPATPPAPQSTPRSTDKAIEQAHKKTDEVQAMIAQMQALLEETQAQRRRQAEALLAQGE